MSKKPKAPSDDVLNKLATLVVSFDAYLKAGGGTIFNWSTARNVIKDPAVLKWAKQQAKAAK